MGFLSIPFLFESIPWQETSVDLPDLPEKSVQLEFPEKFHEEIWGGEGDDPGWHAAIAGFEKTHQLRER